MAALETEQTTSFGYRDIKMQDKQGLVDTVFHNVAHRYDLMNDLMSGGLHRFWKSTLVTKINPSKNMQRPTKILDVAGGTGDIAFRLAKVSEKAAHVTVFDINSSMLDVGRERAEKEGLAQTLDFMEGNAESLPFESSIFDVYTIAFGIRNVPQIDKALKEAYRVLKPGGRFFCLEFSQVTIPLLDSIYDTYSHKVIPKLGAWIADDEESYRYLVESIRRFPNPVRFQAMIEKAGFAHTQHMLYTGGIVAIHTGAKL
jgi:demethylmenaquinone methyltransferase/2-methoxy-6-polyprenyl-1,4-benzoquinol methylase